MTQVDLRRLRLRSGEQQTERHAVDLEPFELGGQRYAARPEQPEVELTVSQTSSGLLFDLALGARVAGPCFRCLEETEIELPIRAQEYQAADGGDVEELRSQYVADDRLDLSAWTRDATALALPDKILCRPDCAGLCPVCGKDLNAEPHGHKEETSDPRWAALAQLKDSL